MRIAQIRVSGFHSQLLLLTPVSCCQRLGKAAVMAQVMGFLPLTRETQFAFPGPSYDLAQPQPLQAYEEFVKPRDRRVLSPFFSVWLPLTEIIFFKL